MKVKQMLVPAVILICGICMAAQETKSPSGKASQKEAMKMPAPAPEMTKLIKAMAGTWTLTEKYYPSPMQPNGGSGKGTAVLTPGPGNLSMVEKYRSTGAMAVPFNASGIFWWDSKAQAYRGVWCDNMIPDGCDPGGTTKWQGENLVGNVEGEMNGQKMVSRYTYSDWTPDSFVMTMEMGKDAMALKKVMMVTYKKAGAAGAAQKPAP